MALRAPTTAAHREGGKFGSMARRGGGKFARMEAAQQQQAADGDSGTESSNVKTKKPRPPRVERQKQIFADLDEAEKLVLGMIQIASSTASVLSDMTEVCGGSSEAEKKLAELAKSNGEEYLAKVKRIHDLLSPHAKLVVAYRNHQVDIKEDGRGEASAGAGSIGPASGTAATAKETNESDKSNNMYASRVEMRLAMERRDVLREMLRIEKEEMEEETKSVPSSTGTSVDNSAKRKREE